MGLVCDARHRAFPKTRESKMKAQGAARARGRAAVGRSSAGTTRVPPRPRPLRPGPPAQPQSPRAAAAAGIGAGSRGRRREQSSALRACAFARPGLLAASVPWPVWLSSPPSGSEQRLSGRPRGLPTRPCPAAVCLFGPCCW